MCIRFIKKVFSECIFQFDIENISVCLSFDSWIWVGGWTFLWAVGLHEWYLWNKWRWSIYVAKPSETLYSVCVVWLGCNVEMHQDARPVRNQVFVICIIFITYSVNVLISKDCQKTYGCYFMVYEFKFK